LTHGSQKSWKKKRVSMEEEFNSYGEFHVQRLALYILTFNFRFIFTDNLKLDSLNLKFVVELPEIV
jgi:hypothetical protein